MFLSPGASHDAPLRINTVIYKLGEVFTAAASAPMRVRLLRCFAEKSGKSEEKTVSQFRLAADQMRDAALRDRL